MCSTACSLRAPSFRCIALHPYAKFMNSIASKRETKPKLWSSRDRKMNSTKKTVWSNEIWQKIIIENEWKKDTHTWNRQITREVYSIGAGTEIKIVRFNINTKLLCQQLTTQHLSITNVVSAGRNSVILISCSVVQRYFSISFVTDSDVGGMNCCSMRSRERYFWCMQFIKTTVRFESNANISSGCVFWRIFIQKSFMWRSWTLVAFWSILCKKKPI